MGNRSSSKSQSDAPVDASGADAEAKEEEKEEKPSVKQNFIRLGDTAPDFTAETTIGTIKFHEFIGDQWCTLFSHPADFTPVCTTEVGTVEKYQPEFRKRNTKCIVLSCDTVADHKKWIKDVIATQNLTVAEEGNLSYPLIGDNDRKIAALYGMLDAEHSNCDGLPLTVRSVFVINPDKKVKLILTYPPSMGRNFDEILRCIDSLQLTASHKVATPANWVHGGDTIIVPSVTNEEAKELFPNGFKEITKYLRVTPQPNIEHKAPDGADASNEADAANEADEE